MKPQRILGLLLLFPGTTLLADDLIFEDLPDGPVRVREDRQGRIYLAVLGKNGVVIRVDHDHAQVWKRSALGGLEVTQDRNVWLVQHGRIWRIGDDGNDAPVDRTPSFRQYNEPGQLFASRWGDLWCRGCRAMRRADAMFVSRALSPRTDWVVSPIADDPFGNVWAIASNPDTGQQNLAVLAREQPHQWSLIGPHDTPSNRWIDVCSDDVGSVWLASKSGVLRVDPQSEDSGGTAIPGPADSQITAIAPVSNRQIVVGFADGSIQELTVKRGSQPHWGSIASGGGGRVRGMLHDRQGWLWVVRGKKLFREGSQRAEWHRHWDEQPQLPAGNHDIAFARIKDRMYTAGGKTYFGWPASQWTHLDHIWSYDVNDGMWRIEAPMLEPGKSYSGIAALHGEVWLLGGYFVEGNGTVGTGTVEVYNPSSRHYRIGPSLDEPRGQVVALTLNDRLYAIGGGVTKMVSIATDESEWQPEPAPPGPVAQASGCILGGRIYVAAGAGSQCPGLFVYDPRERSWSEVSHPAEFAPNAPLCAAHNGEVWVMGGVGRGGARVATHVYAPNSGQWRQGPDLPIPVSWGAAADVNGRLLIAGGAYYETRAKDYHNSDRAFFLRQP